MGAKYTEAQKAASQMKKAHRQTMKSADGLFAIL